MKDRRMLIAAVVLAGLVALKLLFPDLAAAARRTALDALVPDRDYTAVFRELGERLSAARGASGDAPAEAAETAAPVSAPEPETRPAARAQYVSYRVEEAVTAGEYAPVTAETGSGTDGEADLPAAVTAFLESQAEFLDDYDLPDNVDYAYTELPFAYALPVAGYNSSGFGYRMHPILNTVRFHFGTDFAANSGEDIYAFADGTVTYAGPSDSFGNYITIDHGDGWSTLYAHCSRLYAETGQTVKAGERIALVGATGMATGPHLHMELKHDGVYLNPEYYINA